MTTPSPLGGGTPPLSKLAGKSAAAPLLGLGALLASGWMVKDTFKGIRPELDRQYADHLVQDEYANTRWGWGHYSGNPGMDHLAHKFFGFTLFGPNGLRHKWQKAKLYTKVYINNVIIPNLIPMGVGVAGLYALLGKERLHKGVTYFTQGLRKHLKMPPGISKGVKRGVKAIFHAAGVGMGKTLGFAGRNKEISAAVVLLSAFGLNRFRDSYGHDGQDNFFRSYLSGGEGH